MLPRIKEKIQETKTYQRVRAFTKRYERFLMPGMLVGGTVVDAIQFRLLEISTTFILMGVYAVICAAAMLLMAYQPESEWRIMRYPRLAAPFVQQFTIGALLSTSLLFFWFSGTLSASWPIVGLVALFMVSNELWRKYLIRPIVQIPIFYFALFSLSTALSAYVFNSLSPFVFVAGGVFSLLLIAGFLVLFIRAGKLFDRRKRYWFGALFVFAFMNIFYFLNVIPPIPLSLREAGMYYKVTAANGPYVLEGEEETWLERIMPGQTMTIIPGQPLYAYTAIYAPAQLRETMVHRWEYRDDELGAWVTADTLSFAITGGRGEGYQGYSYKTRLSEGRWRVTVETSRGQVLGRIPFRIVYKDWE